MARPSSSNFFLDNDDLRFQLSRVDWPLLTTLSEALFEDEDAFKNPAEARAFFDELLTSLGEYLAKEVAPYAHELDAQHPILKDGEVIPAARCKKILDGLQQMGALALTLPRRLGGSNAPILVNNVLVEMMARADASVVGEFGFHGGIAQALLFYSMEEGSFEMQNGVLIKTRFDDVVKRIVEEGEWGAMVLTEPGAGSDLAQLQTKAIERDGTWRITGQKIFITAGHGDHHIVLARSEDPATHPGLKGLSLFYVPRFIDENGKRCRRTDAGARKNFEIGGVEHKMGQHSAVAATIYYEDSAAELLGQRGHGFLGMLLLMNNARISVGFEGIGMCEAAYRMAKAYADERKAMGKPIARHEMIADYLDEMEVMIRGMRAISFEAAFHEEVATRLKVVNKVRPPATDEARQESERRIRHHKRKARHLTPLIKYIAGEESVRQARMCMQIMGGIGYIVETGAEKILRDALVIPVYEGTSQIQALMALKDNLQAVIRNPGRFLSELATARLEALSARGDLERGEAKLRAHALSAMQTIIMRIAADKLGDVKGRPLAEWKSAFMKDWDPQKDFSFGLLHAERLTKLLAWSAIAETLVRQAQETKGTAAGDERYNLALRFVERFEPRARGVVAEIEATGGSLIGRVLRPPRRERAPAKAAE